MEYLFIGTTLYRVIDSPFPTEKGESELILKLTPWKTSILTIDEGKEFVKQVPKYETIHQAPENIRLLYVEMVQNQKRRY